MKFFTPSLIWQRWVIQWIPGALSLAMQMTIFSNQLFVEELYLLRRKGCKLLRQRQEGLHLHSWGQFCRYNWSAWYLSCGLQSPDRRTGLEKILFKNLLRRNRPGLHLWSFLPVQLIAKISQLWPPDNQHLSWRRTPLSRIIWKVKLITSLSFSCSLQMIKLTWNAYLGLFYHFIKDFFTIAYGQASGGIFLF